VKPTGPNHPLQRTLHPPAAGVPAAEKPEKPGQTRMA